MNFIWEVFSPAELIISSILLVLILTLFYVLIIGTTHRLKTYIVLIAGTILLLFGYIFAQEMLIFIGITIVCSMESIALTVNGKNFLKYFSDEYNHRKDSIKFDENICNILINAVTKFSRAHIGALITIERADDLSPYYEQNGIKVDAPVSSELLETIFYPGTRLHDGAVIIRNNRIMAASVFYTLTTKRYQSKLGSRHRAALGISETTDSVSIVVSEETGKVSLVVHGSLETVTIDNLTKMLKLFMKSKDSK